MSDAGSTKGEWTLTGKHVLAITVSAFAVIIGVNLTLATKAVSTFPGLEVKNSYVASQSFEARRDAQERLGWEVAAELKDGRLFVRFTGTEGAVAIPAEVSALLGRTTSAGEDQRPEMIFDGAAWSAPVDVGRGMWTLMLTATAEDGTRFEKRIPIWVE